MRKIKLFFPKIKKDSDESVIKQIKPTLKSDKILVNGVLFTYILASLVSGVVDLVFFSGLSKSHYNIFAIKIAAPIVMSLLSLVITSGKAWCAIKVSQIDSLVSHLKNYGYNWTRNFRKVRVKWNIAHKLCAIVSIITTISLSVVSIGDGIRRNQNEIRKINKDINKISKLYEKSEAVDNESFKNLLTSSTSSHKATEKVDEIVSSLWPQILEYREERADFTESGYTFDSKEEITWKEKNIIPDNYWNKQNTTISNIVKSKGITLTLNEIRNISEANLRDRLRREFEKSSTNSSSKSLEAVGNKYKEKLKKEIQNLQGRYVMPGKKEYEKFDDNSPTGTLNKLSDIKAAYENDKGDVGDSAKMFMLAGPVVEKIGQKEKTIDEIAEQKDVKVSSFGATEIMIMTLICFFGILQEVLIALLTPKVVVTRKTLASFEPYFGTDFNENEFLYDLYRKYQNKGIISMAEFEAKALKCSTLSETPETLKDFISKSKKTRKKSTSKKVIINNNSETIIDKPIAYSANKDINKKVEETKQVYSEKVDELVNEIENVIGGN